jgi:hypothetical protein
VLQPGHHPTLLVGLVHVGERTRLGRELLRASLVSRLDGSPLVDLQPDIPLLTPRLIGAITPSKVGTSST